MVASLDDIEVAGKRVIVRGDLNVPVVNGKIADTTRIERLAPTIAELGEKGAAVIVMSHFGRPKGKPDPSMSLRKLIEPLRDALGGTAVGFVEDCVGPAVEAKARALEPGDVLLLENLRFHPGEEANDLEFARGLAALADFYVNDAFSAAHRAHASTEAIAHLLPSAAGRLMQAEIEALTRALGEPARPLMAIAGGAKVSTKFELLGNLTEKVDVLAIGGAMANTFLHGLGRQVGTSLCEREMADQSREILTRAKLRNCEILLPADVVVARELKWNEPARTVDRYSVPADHMILDIGPESAKAIRDRLETAKTVVWNGPLGAFEVPPFDAATAEVARRVAELTRRKRLTSIAGGGETIAALAAAGVIKDFSYVSTAGGAFLEWLEGKELPGVKALG
jgi:phosphoglycerate kinase